MGNDEMAVCRHCGKRFVKDRVDRAYCSYNCRVKHNQEAAAQREKQKMQDRKEGCSYNSALICDNHKCENCGWNPIVGERRLKNGLLR